MQQNAAITFTASAEDCVASIRAVLDMAVAENSRMVAAAIGSNLEVISGSAKSHLEIARVDAVRDASLGLLMSLVTKGDVPSNRRAAITSVDRLEASLAA